MSSVRKPKGNFASQIIKLLKENKAISSIIVTCLITVLLLAPTPALAVSVSSNFQSGLTLIKDSNDSYTFTVQMRIEGYERVPVTKLRLFIDSDYWDITNIAGETKGPFTVSLSQTAPYTLGAYYGYGYGYWPWGYGYGTFTYGYGYGYGYGTYGQPATYLKWDVTLDPSSLSTGSHTFKPQVKSDNVWWIGDEVSFNVVDYSLSTSVSSTSVTQGSSTSLTVTVNVTPSGSSLPDDVSLSIATSLPSGISCSFASSTIPSSGGSTTLTISATATASTGTYNITIKGTCKSVYRTTTITLEVVEAAAAAPAAAPAPAPAPTAEDIISNPEEGAESLENLVAQGRVDEAVDVLEEAAQTDPAAAAEALVGMDNDAAAEVLEEMAEDVAADLIQEAVLLGEVEDIANVVELMDPVQAAEVFDVLATENPEVAAQVLAHVSPASRAMILANVARLPSTPDKAAAILEEMSIDKAVEAIEHMVKMKYLSEAADILYYVSDETLAQIWAGMAETYKNKLIPYMHADTLAKLKLLFKAKKANLLILPAGAVKTVSYVEETGVEFKVSAVKPTAGVVKACQYVVNPKEEASLPEAVSLKKFLYLSALFPEDTVSQITATIHYTDKEMAGVLEFTITVYKYDHNSNSWIPIETTVDKAGNTATITLTEPGIYALGGI